MRKLAIAIPTYNRAPLLDLLLGQLIGQIRACRLDSQVGLFVSDNCSTDGTAAVVRRHQRQNPGIQIGYRKNPRNLGWGPNFALAIEGARGEYVWLFGDDDQMRPGAMWAMLEAIGAQAPDLLVCNYEHYDPTMQRNLGHAGLHLSADARPSKAEFYKTHLRHIGTLSILVYKKSAFQKAWPGHEISRHSTHIELAIRILKAGGQAYVLSNKLVRTRAGGWKVDKLIEYHTLDGVGMLNALEPQALSSEIRGAVRTMPQYLIFAKESGALRGLDFVPRAARIYGRFPEFWLVLPLYFVPDALVAAGLGFYRRLRRRPNPN